MPPSFLKVSSFSASQYEDDNTQDPYDPHGPGEQEDPESSMTVSTPRSLNFAPSATQRTVDYHHKRTHSTNESVHERSGLLQNPADMAKSYRSIAGSGLTTPKFQRQSSYITNQRMSRPSNISHLRSDSYGFSQRLVSALSPARTDTSFFGLNSSYGNSKFSSQYINERGWYDQFTSTDWMRDTINHAFRVKQLKQKKGLSGRITRIFDAGSGWILVAIIGFLTALCAYFVDLTEVIMFDYKKGYCEKAWYMSKKRCCSGASLCAEWRPWSQLFTSAQGDSNSSIDYAIYVITACFFAMMSYHIAMTTKTVVPSHIAFNAADDNFAEQSRETAHKNGKQSPNRGPETGKVHPPHVYYPAAGSGVAEIKVIVSGYVLHGYLGLKTLVAKILGLILAVASGLSVGKEGPFVHIASCIGNIISRFFPKYYTNDMKRREALSASGAAGVAVAFGAPIAGVLFSLEEVSYYFPPKTLFRTFFCCIVAAISLKLLNPYGTHKIVLFEVRYIQDWKYMELPIFVFIGVMGGVMGAFFIKATRFWALNFRRIPVVKLYPGVEVFIIALITGIVSWWNRYTKLPVAELLLEIASPCDAYTDTGVGLCPTKDQIPEVIWYLLIAFVIKTALTTVTFGLKVPAGIYVPSMVVGGLVGRIIGHSVQYMAMNNPTSFFFSALHCDANAAPEKCVVPGVYALVAAGATMCGVTRLSVTLAVILFELTGSLEHVLPFSVGVLVSKWIADYLEPRSIYDLLTDLNAYPFLDNKERPTFEAELGHILPRTLRTARHIDITVSPLVPAIELREKVEALHSIGEIDGGLPIIRAGVLVGLIPAPDLEFALDRLDNEENSLCLMSPDRHWMANDAFDTDDEGERIEQEPDPTDFTAFIDPAPVALDVRSPMDTVYECFVKLGLRYVCALRDGQFAGMVHKKTFVKYCSDLHQKEGH